jgi:hypothetical protein
LPVGRVNARAEIPDGAADVVAGLHPEHVIAQKVRFGDAHEGNRRSDDQGCVRSRWN